MFAPNTAEIQNLQFPGRLDPGADWMRASDYPELKPRRLWGGEEYLRLAWEIIRRSPRYRLHYYRLKRDGLLLEEAFKAGRPYLSSAELIGLPEWELIPAYKHYCEPWHQEKELLGSFVERNAGDGWLVVHGHWYVKTAWGISTVCPPETAAQEVKLDALFAPNLPRVVVSEGDKAGKDYLEKESPWSFRTRLTQRQAVVVVRFDLPVADQQKLIASALSATRARLGVEDEDVRLRERVSSAALWLRAWDHARCGSDRHSLVRALHRHIDAIPDHVANEFGYTKGGIDYSFRQQARGWVDLKLDTVVGHASKLIETEEGASFLAHCIGEGLSLLAEGSDGAKKMRLNEDLDVA